MGERKKRYEYYMDGLLNVNGIRFFNKNIETTNNYAYFPIIIEDEYGLSRDELYEKLKENNIYSRKYFYPLTSDQACFKNKYKNEDLDCARELAKKIIVLPFYEKMEYGTIQEIIRIVQFDNCEKKIGRIY